MLINPSKLIIINKLKLPAGIYYVSDPCYLYKSEENDKLEAKDWKRRSKLKNGDPEMWNKDKSIDYWGDFCDKFRPYENIEYDIERPEFKEGETKFQEFEEWIDKRNKFIFEKKIETENKHKDGHMFEYDGIPFFVWSTYYGDGIYPVNLNGKNLGAAGVDAGLLSLFPQKLVDLLKNQKLADKEVKIELNQEFEIVCKNGDAKFADYTVFTSGLEDGFEDIL